MSSTIDALIGDAPAAAPEKRVYTVTQYNRGVERRIREIPATWVKGVITQLQVRGKVVYLTLGEFEEGDARPKAVLDVIIWTAQFEAFNARFAQLPTPFVLRPELKVSLLLEAGFYVPSGRFQTKVLDIDESFTLGELAVTRQKILEALQREGLLEKNKRLPFPELPLRVGLISSRGSAAYQDFTTVLLQSGFSFEIFFVEARMQGVATETTVRDALQRFARLPAGKGVDVICLVRGGGSKTDLVFFDSEMICRAIAASPVPVLTGIGHEIDRSLADIVAWDDLLTPTDCAKYLEARLSDAFAELVARATGVRGAWESAYQYEGRSAVQKAELLRTEWDARAQRESQRQSDFFRNIALTAARLIRAGHDKLRLNRTGLSRGPDKLIRLETVGLDLKAKLLQASDPAELLKRGFAQVVSTAGKWVRSARDLAAGDEIKVRFADGEIGAVIRTQTVSESETGSGTVHEHATQGPL
jgi:exodeoxyribonuclease VII large subunit